MHGRWHVPICKSLRRAVDNKNPFAPSEYQLSPEAEGNYKGRSSFRMAVLIFAVPALVNYFLWDRQNLASRYATDIVLLLRGGNLFLIALLFLLIWFLALPLLNFLLSLLPPVRREKESWDLSWGEALKRLPTLSMLGAGLWICWCIAFYVLESRGFFVMKVFAIMGHLLAAAWYVPLLLTLRRIWQPKSSQDAPASPS